MAEGFDFTVSIPVDYNFGPARETARRELDALQKTPVSVPVGTGAPATTVPGIGAVPHSTAVAAAAQAAVQQALAPSSVSGGTVSGAVVAAASRAGIPVSFAPAVINIPGMGGAGFYNPGGAGGPMTGGPSVMTAGGAISGGDDGGTTAAAVGLARRQSVGLIGRGILLGLTVRAAGHVAMATIEHERAFREAEGDPSAIARADVQYRERFARAFPIAGDLGLALREYVTGEEEGITRTLRRSESQDQRTELMRASMEQHIRFQDAARLAREMDPVRQKRIAAEQAYQSADRTIRERQRVQEEAERKPFSEQRAELINATERKLAGIPLRSDENYWADLELREQVGRDEASGRRQIDKAEAAALAQVRKQYDADREAARAVRGRARRDINVEERRSTGIANYMSRTGVEAAGLRAAGQDFAATQLERWAQVQVDVAKDPYAPLSVKAGIVAAGAADIGANVVQQFRDSAIQQGRMEITAAGIQAQINRDQLGAALAGIRGQRYDALATVQKLPPFLRGIAERGINFISGLEEQRVRQQISDEQGLRRAGLEAEVDVTAREARGEEKSARALGIQRRAEIESEASRQRGEPIANQRLILQAALNEEKTYLRALRLRGEQGTGQETYGGALGPGAGPGVQQEPIVQAITRVEAIAQGIRQDLARLVGQN
jgi:hypothetical protein